MSHLNKVCTSIVKYPQRYQVFFQQYSRQAYLIHRQKTVCYQKTEETDQDDRNSIKVHIRNSLQNNILQVVTCQILKHSIPSLTALHWQWAQNSNEVIVTDSSITSKLCYKFSFQTTYCFQSKKTFSFKLTNNYL